MGLYQNTKEGLVSVGGDSIAYIATGASTTTLKSGPGRLCRVSITTAGTAAITIYDNTAGSGSVLWASPASTTAGTVYDIQLPALTGITVVNVVSGPVVAVSFA